MLANAQGLIVRLSRTIPSPATEAAACGAPTDQGTATADQGQTANSSCGLQFQATPGECRKCPASWLLRRWLIQPGGRSSSAR